MKTLVLGGARSGKSARAEYLAGRGSALAVTYVATARGLEGDADFLRRVAAHRARRPQQWITEDSRDAIDVLAAPDTPVILVDDMGTWLTHVIDRAEAWDKPRGTVGARVDELVAAVQAFDAARELVIVSPEVGLSVIPEHYSGRLFRDELGALNARLATACDAVELVVAGCRLRLK